MILNEMIDVDLPSLQKIELSYCALQGMPDDYCSLTMKSNNDMI